MQNTDIPVKFSIPFANSAGAGFIRPIPTPSQSGGAASLTDGFPPPTASPIGSGGVPPDIKDFNGILQQVTANNRWVNAGGVFYYDGAYSTLIGGYPQGARLASASVAGLTWVSTTNNNVTDPDGISAAGWIALGVNANVRTISGAGSFTFLDSDYYLGLKLTGAASSVLPASPSNGRIIVVQDLLYNFFAKNVVISPNSGQNIGGRTGAYTANENGQTMRFTFYGSNTWGLES